MLARFHTGFASRHPATLADGWPTTPTFKRVPSRHHVELLVEQLGNAVGIVDSDVYQGMAPTVTVRVGTVVLLRTSGPVTTAIL